MSTSTIYPIIRLIAEFLGDILGGIFIMMINAAVERLLSIISILAIILSVVAIILSIEAPVSKKSGKAGKVPKEETASEE